MLKHDTLEPPNEGKTSGTADFIVYLKCGFANFQRIECPNSFALPLKLEPAFCSCRAIEREGFKAQFLCHFDQVHCSPHNIRTSCLSLFLKMDSINAVPGSQYLLSGKDYISQSPKAPKEALPDSLPSQVQSSLTRAAADLVHRGRMGNAIDQ
jgi:hypothetical protein